MSEEIIDTDSKKDLKSKTLKGFFWRFGERISSQAVSFIVSIVLARLLEPEDYGVVALTMVFMAIANSLAISGLGSSLIQKKDADELDFSTMFHAGLILSFVLYLILYITAPYIAIACHEERVAPVLKVLGLMLPISSINSIQQAYVSRKLDFKKFFYATSIGTIISGVVGIIMAYCGYGVWALVGQQLTNSVVNTFTLNRIINWHPQWLFSFERLKELYSFGLKLMGSNLIGSISNQLKNIIVGVKYQPADLAFFNRGEHIPHLIANNINNTINAVLFPAISKLQDDRSAVKNAIRRSVMTSTFVMVPIMFLIAVTSDKIVIILLTKKWLPCVPFMQVLCINCCLEILGTANLQTFNALGRSDITLKLEFIKKPIYLLIILTAMYYSPLAIAIGCCIYSFISTAINAWPNKNLINYSLVEQVKDVLPQFLIGIIMAVVIYLVGFLDVNIYLMLIVQIIIGVVVYWSLSVFFSLESYRYFWDNIKFIKKN